MSKHIGSFVGDLTGNISSFVMEEAGNYIVDKVNSTMDNMANKLSELQNNFIKIFVYTACNGVKMNIAIS